MQRREFIKTVSIALGAGGLAPRTLVAEDGSLARYFVENKPRLDKVVEFIKAGMRELIELKLNTRPLRGPKLPHPFIPVDVAENRRDFYYWDSYFIIRELLKQGHVNAAMNQLRDFLFMIDKYGYVPNANVYLWAGHSQPPLLTSMVRLIVDRVQDQALLKECYPYLKKEYGFWTGNYHLVKDTGFSRYQDTGLGWYGLLGHPQNKITNLQAEAESGWDFNPRFENRCLQFLPVDLNSWLYKYETDLAWMAKRLSMAGDEEKTWTERAEARRKNFNRIFWNDQEKFYFDYDFKNGRQGKVWSLAGFMPLWVGLADKDQARAAAANLQRFQKKCGLSVCDQDYGFHDRQWNHPNSWPPLTWWVEECMRAYGYEKEWQRIAMQYLEVQTSLFEKHGAIYEKYNAETGGLDVTGGHERGTSPMLGWSASTFTDFYDLAKLRL